MHINIGVATLVSILVANTTQHGNKASISIKKITIHQQHTKQKHCNMHACDEVHILVG
jgi:hypothetical protein